MSEQPDPAMADETEVDPDVETAPAGAEDPPADPGEPLNPA
jgi:hypothetical protein